MIDHGLVSCLKMIFSENRVLPRIKSVAGFFGIMFLGWAKPRLKPKFETHGAWVCSGSSLLVGAWPAKSA